MPDSTINSKNQFYTKQTNKSKVKSSAGNYTENGTRIVKPGGELDKNAFLMILSAELSHQDPMNAKDGTEFVSQMAQFAALEQMTNLNSNMRFIGATSLIGKVVMVNRVDENGDLYFGKVKGVSRDKDSIRINVVVGETEDEEGNIVDVIQQFNLEDIIELINNPIDDGKDIDDGQDDEEDIHDDNDENTEDIIEDKNKKI
ncbi:flagellar hook assembly protein FlgD [Clostridium rectalis]|uniref:flagellar hook assembly protein FlgD n=1 Tax=Clostridium rectalis TaxID=2040295 RepID=UPI000F63D317|nr:flagellar hook capping FlgD N-terminal domain-containing protein [Clostridium rectalis]